MPRQRSQHASSSGANYQLVIVPVSGTAIRTSISGSDIAALLDGSRVLFADEGGHTYVAELVSADGAAQPHHGRARARTSAELSPPHSEEAEVSAGGLG